MGSPPPAHKPPAQHTPQVNTHLDRTGAGHRLTKLLNEIPEPDDPFLTQLVPFLSGKQRPEETGLLHKTWKYGVNLKTF